MVGQEVSSLRQFKTHSLCDAWSCGSLHICSACEESGRADSNVRSTRSSQAAAADITLPNFGGASTNVSALPRWDDDDPLLFGAAPGLL
jgi:hypothetical protein